MEPTPIEFKSKPLNKKQKTFISALRASMGIISQASKLTGIIRNTHYVWMKANPTYKQAVEEIDEETLDFGETQLHKLMTGVQIEEIRRKPDPDNKEKVIEETVVYTSVPDKSAVIFFLKTKGKKRGYIERTEITGAEGTPLGGMAPIIVQMQSSKPNKGE